MELVAKRELYPGLETYQQRVIIVGIARGRFVCEDVTLPDFAGTLGL